MTFKLKYKILKRIALFIAFNMFIQAVSPLASYALTSGPGQPEFSSFEPVATTNMVNEFSGDFTYNLPVLEIPGASGGGYAMSLSYHSGTSPEEEASWVGYGWSLNPGAISRGKRGFPDDYNGEAVKYVNMMPKNWTVTAGGSAKPEFFSSEVLKTNANATLRYNNYRGFGYTAGISLSAGVASLGFSVSDGHGSFSASINPAAFLDGNPFKKKNPNSTKKSADEEQSKKELNKDLMAKKKSDKSKKSYGNSGIGRLSLLGSTYGLFSMSDVVQASNITSYTGASYNFTVGLIPTGAPIQAGPNGSVIGSYSWQQGVTSESLAAYGYMYAANSGADNDIMDYYVEKENPYDKRDQFLGVPISNADQFTVTGEGVGGGFRLHSRKAGHYHPNRKTSTTNIYNIGVELELGGNFGGGGDIGFGQQTLKVNEWNDLTSFTNTGDEPYFFRFNGDLGGSVEFGSNDNAQQAKHSSNQPTLSGTGIVSDMSGGRSGRSSYIAYHTNSDWADTSNGNSYYVYTLDDSTAQWIDRNDNSIDKGIGEIVTFNEDGMRYNYGLPVYSRNEISMQYGVQGASPSDVDNNYIVRKDIGAGEISGNTERQIGEIRYAPYATSYLLTAITTPDYVDRTLNGPTSDDFGGYTKFNYEQAYGNDKNTAKNEGSGWYNWRIPYNGLLYNRNSLSDIDDDMGSVTLGEKEVYYLSSVETKTHIAIYRTSDRKDGIDALDNETAANDNSTSTGNNKLQQLDRIDLYAKDEDGAAGKLIKSVVFEYDYSLSQGLPNSNGVGDSTGKLTLTKVHFEYEGVVNAKIAPYIFKYEYKDKTEYPDNIKTLYSDIVSFADSFDTDAKKNPPYNPVNLDAWGNYQKDGGARFEDMKNWNNQNPDNDFDPAVWQLKQIKLPSGGEILVQYEQDDYQYVQDKRAMVMAPLKDVVGSEDKRGDKYYIDVSEFGVDLSEYSGVLSDNPELQALKNLMYRQFIKNNEKIYFKFLYRLLGDERIPYISDCNAEYITGYVNVYNIGIDNTNGLWIQIGNENGGQHDLPKKACKELVRAQKGGRINKSGNCDASAVGIDDNSDASTAVMALMGKFGMKTSGNCAVVNFPLSYFRIPLHKAKKGGGLRVKRLLMYDKGIETGDAALYGSEYIYETIDNGEITSSGVATNEPSNIREENALVHFQAKDPQSTYSRVIAGRDKEQLEGPFGETVFPGASVGYSKVIVKNIHEGKTNTGITINEFYTARNYPVVVENTIIDKNTAGSLMIPLGIVNIKYTNRRVTQGYSIKLNSMHGQSKSVATYGADYTSIHNPSRKQLSTKQEFEYYGVGEAIPTIDKIGGAVTYKNLGKEAEVVFESRQVIDKSSDGNIEFDGDVGFVGIPLPFISFMPSMSYARTNLASHVTTKIINYPAIQKSVKTYQDGIYHVTENLAFNSQTGKPIITQASDGYDGLNLLASADHEGVYTNYTYPASTEYRDMGRKADNEGYIYSGLSGVALGSGYISGLTTSQLNSFKVGDLIKVNSYFYQVDNVDCSNTRLYVEQSDLYSSTASIGTITSIDIIKSGATNQLNTQTGSITTYGASTTSFAVDTLFGIEQQLNQRQQLVDALNTLSWGTTFNDTLNIYTTNYDSIYVGSSEDICGCSNINDKYLALIHEGYFEDYATTYGEYNFLGGNSEGINCSESQFPIYGIGAENEGIEYFLDESTGEIYVIYGYTEVGGFEKDTFMITCLSPCVETAANQSLSNVISASAQSYDHDWTLDADLLPVYNLESSDNPYETGQKGKWRQKDNYVYKSTIIGGAKTAERNYNDAGVFDTFTVFNWADPTSNDPNWIKLNTVTAYSPNGNALEEENILGIKSTAKFGYDNTLPYLVAQNTDYGSVQFQSFERSYGSPKDTLEDGFVISSLASKIDNTTAHSGAQSLSLTAIESVDFKDFTLTQQMIDEGLSIKVWAKAPFEEEDTLATLEHIQNGTVESLDGWSSSGNVTVSEVSSQLKVSKSGCGGGSCAGIVSNSLDNNMPIGSQYELNFKMSSYTKGSIDSIKILDVSSNTVAEFAFSADAGGDYKTTIDMSSATAVGTAFQFICSTGSGGGTSMFTLDDISVKEVISDPSISSPIVGTISNTSISFNEIAEVGEWRLFEAKVTDWTGFTKDEVLTPNISNNTKSSGINLDDVRIQPLDAQMICYVYDVNTLRLVASFDDQHFGLVYQYNAEGKLIRKKIETERGTKTIQETQYHTPLVSRGTN